MTVDQFPSATPAPAPEDGRSVWTNFRDAILAPSATFEDVGQRPRWVAPLLVIMALTVVSSFLLLPMSTAMQEYGLSRREMSPEQREQAINMIRMFKWVGLGIAPIFVAIFSAIYGLFFWAWAAIAGAKNASFKIAFTALLYAGIVLSLQAFAQAVVVMVKGAERVALEGPPTFGLALFLERGDMGRWMWGFIQNVSFFTVWHAVLVGMAGIYALKMSKGSATMFAIFVWVLNILWLAMQAPAAG